MREVRSSVSVVMGVLEARELNETELSEGESRGGLWIAGTGFLGAGDADGVGGARFLPLPRTRPPPRLLREAILKDLIWRLPVFQKCHPCCASA